MRAASLALSSVLVSSLVLAGACSAEHFPLSLSFGEGDGGLGASEASIDSGALPPLEANPPAIIPPDQRVDATSSPVVFDPVRGGVWTANGDVGSVSYADVGTFSLVQEIPVGTDLRSVALSPDGHWLAAVDRAAGTVALIDADARALIRTIAVGTHPRAAVWDSANPRWLYVAVEDIDGVAIIDRTAGVLSATVGVGRLPSGVAVSRQRRELYVTHRIDGKVTVVPLTDDADAGADVSGDHRIHLSLLDGALVEGGSDDASLDATTDAGFDATVGAAVDAAAPASNDAGSEAGEDASLSVLPALASPIDVPLAYEVGDGTANTPHGTPFGLESLAWAVDGNVAWVPHELLAATHPFQFQTTVFPTISVVDLSQRAEVQTNPFDPNGVVAGRKNLFAAIDLFDQASNPIVLSQPCAVAFHPNGFTAYAVACGSEDLLTFDVTQGIAIDILRNLPGDHPMGIALDTAGARAFILDDESSDPASPAAPLHSKSLHVIDLAGGSLFGHATVIGTAIPLVAKDPLDANLRAGLRYFFRANAQKGTYAITGNDWMSCAACHLDGFVSTNQAFFDILTVGVNPSVNAQIGHSGLVDFFSTSAPANQAGDPPFNPHDILSAMTEMGGLSPDRTGATRTGAVDPSAPPSDLALEASQIATVIARDLPLGPTWLLPTAGEAQPDASYDGAWCGQCHAPQYAAWQKSAHAHAAVDPMVLFCTGVEVKNNGVQYSRLCAGCHDPVSSRLGDTALTSGRGITCLGCHDAARTIRAGGNEDLQVATNDWTVDHKARATASLTTLRDPRFCGTCHQQFVPGTALPAIGTLHEYQGSIFAGADDAGPPVALDGGSLAPVPVQEDAGGAFVARCVDCHAPVAGGVADHSMVGGNVYLASAVTNDATMVAAEQANLQGALTLSATRTGVTVTVTVTNRGAGHSFPTGVTDIREPWVELQAVDASKNVVATYGGPAADGTIPASAARFGIDIADADGGLLLEHELSKAVSIPFNRVVPPRGSVQVTLTAPATLPTPAVELDAVLSYRNVRTTYFRLATGSTTATAPTTELARTTVP